MNSIPGLKVSSECRTLEYSVNLFELIHVFLGVGEEHGKICTGSSTEGLRGAAGGTHGGRRDPVRLGHL